MTKYDKEPANMGAARKTIKQNKGNKKSMKNHDEKKTIKLNK